MRSRPLISVGGPAGAGKTTFVEQVLKAFDELIAAARCVQDNSGRCFQESCPKNDPELRRYRRAGASAVARFAFPATDFDLDLVYSTRLMEDYSQALVLEGDGASPLCQLVVHVVPPLEPGGALLVRRWRDRAREQDESIAALETTLQQPDGAMRIVRELLGDAGAVVVSGKPDLVEKMRADLLLQVARARGLPPVEPTEHWGIATGYEGIEQAQLVVVNLRSPRQLPDAERLLADLVRIRKEPDILRDLLGWRGKRTPITGVAADLSDPKHPGTRKALARIRRCVRQP